MSRRRIRGHGAATTQPDDLQMQEYGETPTQTTSDNIERRDLKNVKQKRDNSAFWYPVETDERCKKKNCKYHSVHPSSPHGCEYSLISEEPKTHNPKYKRLYPPSEGCTLYEPAPPKWHEIRLRELRTRENQQAQAASRISKLYQKGIYHDYSKSYTE